jgi:hypothetical protein
MGVPTERSGAPIVERDKRHARCDEAPG